MCIRDRLKRINGLVDDDGVYNFSYQAAALEDPAYVVELFDKLWACLLYTSRFGLFELRAREVVHVGVDQRRDLLVDLSLIHIWQTCR